MDFENAAADLTEMALDGAAYLRTNLPIVDFTKPFQGVLEIYGKKKVLTIDLSTPNELATISYLLTTILDDRVLIIGWNIKELITYLKFNLTNKATINFTAKVIDLRLIEVFSGQNLSAPESLAQAVKRMGAVYTAKNKIIANKIHTPLSMTVIPSMEMSGILDTELRKRVYPYYEIEKQVNGRLQSSKAFPLAIFSHGLTPSDKEKLKLRSEEEVFIYFDFKSMEVAVLQYLSQDQTLAKMLVGDCYKNIWTALFNSNCETPEQRKLIKECFLPIVFGLGITGIMEKTGCSQEAATALTKGLRSRFKKAFEYVDNYQEGHLVEDHFGRKRYFDDPKSYLIRNFVIQAPAAIICMEKLIDLYQVVGDKLLLSIHDGYVIRCNPKFDKPLIVQCKKVLESPSQLAPELKLSVDCGIGIRLNKMKPLKI